MNPRLKTALAVLMPALALVTLFWNVWPTLGTRFAGIEYVDHYGTQWFYWFTEQAVLGDESAVHTDLMFFPFGKDIYGHTGANVLDALAAIPFRRALGHVAGYNSFLFVGMALSALAAARFAYHLTRDVQAASLAAVVLALSPWVLFEAMEGRPTQALLGLPILFMHAAWVSGTEKGWRAPLLAGMYLALTGYQYWFYAFFVGLGCVIWGLWATWRRTPGAGPWWQILSRFALAAAVALVLCAPAVLPMLLATSGADTEIPGLLHVEVWNLRATPPLTDEGQLVGIFNWQPLRRAAGFYVTDFEQNERFLTRVVLTPLLTLPLLGLWLYKPGTLKRGPVLGWLVLAVLLATGPLFIIGSVLLPNPVYISLTQNVGFFQRLWWPGRAYVLIALMMPFVAALALMAIPSRWRTAAWAGLALGWAVEARTLDLFPFETWNAGIPAGYKCLATGPEGAVLELPYNFTQAHLYYQIQHGRPIFGGMLENNKVFTPRETTELLKNNTLLIALRDPSSLYESEFKVEPEHYTQLEDLGFRYVLLQKDAFLPPVTQELNGLAATALRSRSRNTERVIRNTLGTPVYNDARISIYPLAGVGPPCDPKSLEQDNFSTGNTEADPITREAADAEAQIIVRPFPPEEVLKLRRLSLSLGAAAGLAPEAVDTGDVSETLDTAAPDVAP